MALTLSSSVRVKLEQCHYLLEAVCLAIVLMDHLMLMQLVCVILMAILTLSAVMIAADIFICGYEVWVGIT